ncbi:hypothetical protein PIB30_075863, partial [Stylosanthes scabra]|nr:hypothetical protein [Stylosanthes scabra]
RSRNRLSIVGFVLATPTILTSVRSCKRITQWRQLTTSMMPLPVRPTTSNIILKEGARVNQFVGTHLSSHKLSLGSLIPTVSPRTARIQDINPHIIVNNSCQPLIPHLTLMKPSALSKGKIKK